MPGKTRKHSKKSHKRRTLRRVPRRVKGGADSQALTPPNSSFGAKIGAPVNTDNVVHKIA